jgi:hypothetical protein
MKKFVLSVLALALLVITPIGCAPVVTPISPTFTPMPSSTPTITFTPTITSTPTITITPSPLPSPTASFDVKRVSLKEFIPDLLFDFPVSFEIPQDYVLFSAPGEYGAYYWMPQGNGELFQKTETKPRGISFFVGKPSLNVGYDVRTDKFIGPPNDPHDKDIISIYESQGIKLNRVERKNLGEFPILILEFELPYAETTRLVNMVYLATLVETNVLWITYYFTLPANPEKDRAIWERFEASLERNP